MRERSIAVGRVEFGCLVDGWLVGWMAESGLGWWRKEKSWGGKEKDGGGFA